MKIKKDQLKVISLKNGQNTCLEILNFGAAILSFKITDKNDVPVNIIVSPRAEEFITQAYKEYNKCFGASIGRYAGRISEGKFKLDDETFKLYQNDGVHLHGGERGFQYKLWEVEEETSGHNPTVTLSYTSPNEEEGYPGNLKASVTYTLTEENELQIEYSATTDKETVVNLTNHAYFNLNGEGSISDHFLQLDARQMLEVDKKLLPTGNLTKLKEHPKNFSESKLIGNRSLDDTFVLNSGRDETAAILYAPLTGIKMKLSTNQPGVVAYAPEELPDGLNYRTEISDSYPSLCLEAQNFPNAPNFRNFPSAVLKPGEKYYNQITYAFSVSK